MSTSAIRREESIHGGEETSPAGQAQAARWVRRLGPGTHTRELVGGKGAGLERLMAAGYEVPPSVCVTTEAFEVALGIARQGARDLEELRARLRELPLPAGLEARIEAELEDIGAETWAVRSSARAEDAEAHSFAGQQITCLHISGIEQIGAAIRRVWASLYELEALVYRAEMGAEILDPPEGMAVILQPMLEPMHAGVLFTTDPMVGAQGRGVAVVSAARGLGTRVVEGREGTSTYYLERPSGYTRRREGDGGEIERAQLRELAGVAEHIEGVCGAPQDLEWAYVPDEEGGDPRLVLLQMRPVHRPQAPGRLEAAPTVWTNANVGEALPGVGTPMTWSIIRKFSRRGFEQAFGTMGLKVREDDVLVGSFRGRVYLNLTQFMRIASGIPILRPETLFSMAGGGGLELVQQTYESRPAGRFLVRLPVTALRVVAAQLSMPALAPLWEDHFERQCERVFDRDFSRMGHGDLVELVERVDELFERNGLIMLTVSSNFLMSYVVMREVLGLWGGHEALEREQALVSGIETRSAEPGLELLELGRLARRSRRLRRIIAGHEPGEVLEVLQGERDKQDVAQFLEALAEFRRAHGHRAPREAELATPRWREDATFIFEVVRGFLSSPHLPSPREVEREREQLRQEAEELIGSTFGAVTAPLFELLVRLVRANARRREALRARVVESLAMFRHVFLECGRRMVEQGQLLAPEDVFFLSQDEVDGWLTEPGCDHGFGLRVMVRRTIFEHQRAQPDPPPTFLLRGRELVPESELVGAPTGPASAELEASEGDETIFGLPGSAGRVTGRARVLFDPHQKARLQHGEVLVVPYADVGWTPLFLGASAVVMSLGGPLSHACIVAREYGIPTVVNAQGAAQTIRDGDRVTVDGDRGVVLVHRDPEDRSAEE